MLLRKALADPDFVVRICLTKRHFRKHKSKIMIAGYEVLCNTSLNFHGAGFINRTSDLVSYAEQAGLDGFVIQGPLFLRDWQPTCK